jgi:hypothetical protein
MVIDACAAATEKITLKPAYASAFALASAAASAAIALLPYSASERHALVSTVTAAFESLGPALGASTNPNSLPCLLGALCRFAAFASASGLVAASASLQLTCNGIVNAAELGQTDIDLLLCVGAQENTASPNASRNAALDALAAVLGVVNDPDAPAESP